MSASEAETPFLNLVLECNQAQDSDGDSFSTLGLHSIFSEDDHRNAAYYKKREQPKPKAVVRQQQKQQPKRKCPSPALGKFLVESSEDDEDEMDLRALLRRGSRMVDGFAKNKGLHNSFSNLESTQPPKFQGNRWLESTGRSVSCRNLGYESESSCGSRRSKPEAIGHSKSRDRDLNSPPPPLQPLMAMMDASCASDSVMDASAISEAEDIDISTPSRSARRTKSLSAGLSKGSRRTVRSSGERSRSAKERGRQTPETAPCTPLSSQGATDKALRALVKQNSFVNLNPSSPESRKTMLSMGKSVSSRNLMLNSDSKSLSPKRLTLMKSKSVRHFTAEERGEEYVPEVFAVSPPLSPDSRPRREMNPPLSPGSRPRRHSRSRRLAAQKSKSARHFTEREREEDMPELNHMTFSPPSRSTKMASGVPKEQPSFNGRKFMSYSKSLSCRDLSSREEEPSRDLSLMMPRRQQTIERPTRSQADIQGSSKDTPMRDHSLTPPKRMPTADRPCLKTSRPTTPASEAPTLKRSTVSEAFKSRPCTPASEAPTLKRSTVSEAFKSRPSTPASEAPTLKRSSLSSDWNPTSRPCTPSSELHKRRASRPNTPASKMDLPSLTPFSPADHRPSSASRPNTPAAFRSRPNTPAATMERPSLQKRAFSERALTVSRPLTLSRPSTPSAALHDTPSGSSMQKSLSSFLQKRVESEKITTAVEAIPGRRSKLAKLGMSKSARNLVDGRKSKLSFGKSLSARSLISTDGSLSELSPIPASPCVSISDLSKQQESVNLSVCQEESSKNEMDESTPGSLLDMKDTGGMDGSTPGMDGSMPGLSPMTPLKTPSMSKPVSSPLCALSVVGEESLSQIVPSLPLGHTDSDAACASNDSDEADMYQTTTVESESEEEADSASEEETEATDKSAPKEYKLGFSDRIAPQEYKLGFSAEDDKPPFSTEEICKDMGLSTSEALSPIREAGGKALVSSFASKRAQSARRLSAHKESKSPSAMSPRASFQGNTSSLKAALQKAVSAVNADGRRPSTSGRSLKRTDTHDSRSSLRKSVSHDSTGHEDRKSSYRRTTSCDSTASSMHENSKKSYKRTVSRDSTNRSSSTRGSGKTRSQDGSKKAGRRSTLSKQSSVSARSSQEKKSSSLKTALDKSRNDESVQGKKSSSRRASSTNKRRESVSGRKDERQRSSRNLIRKESKRNMAKRESQRNLSKKESQRSMVKKESQRNLVKKESQRNLVKKESQRNLVRKESQRNVSASHQGLRQRALVAASDKSMSRSAHSAGRRRSSRSTAAGERSLSVSMGGESKVREMNVSNSSSQPSQDSGSRHKKRRQRSSRRLLIEEPADPESTRSSSSSKGVHKKERKRRSSRPTAEELRANSPSCVTEYSAGEKASLAHGKRAKESRKKRSSLPNVSPPRPCLKRPDRHTDMNERLGTSLRDIRGAPRTNSGSSHRDPRSDRSHGSWSTADFSSVVW